MLKTFIIIFIALLCALPVSATETAAPLKSVISALEKGYAGLQDVRAGFTQKTVIAAVKREQSGNGEVLMKRPASSAAMFRFNYTKPKQQIISNGKQVWFYTPETKQVLVSSVAAMFAGGNSIALSYLTGLGHVSQDFDIAFASQPVDKNGNYQLELTPKKASQVIAKLGLTVSAQAVEQLRATGEVKNTFPILASVVHDASGNSTRIDYNHALVNKGIDNGKFNFKIPVGVEVIKP